MNEQKKQDKRFDFFLIALILISVTAFIVQVYFVSQVKFIGSSDPAFYANVADNLIKGKGFVLDVINTYFVKFNSIPHPEEYGFPGVSIILVPFILLFGKTAFAVKLPSMIAGVILLPILTYFLGKEFFSKRIGFLSAISMLFYPAIFPLSFSGERDTLFAFFLVAGIYFFYRGIKNENKSMAPKNSLGIIEFLKENKYFLLMGVFLGYSYLIRQVTLFIIPLLIIIYYLINKNLSRKFFYGLGVCALIMSPWLIRNYLVFGDPFFTVNKYIGWIVGYAAFSQEQIFRVFWDKPKPDLFYQIYSTAPYPFYLVYARKLLTNLADQFRVFILFNLLTFVGIVFASHRKLTKKVSAWVAFLLVFSILAFIFNKYMQITSIYKIFIYAILLVIPYVGIMLSSFFLFKEGTTQNITFIILLGGHAVLFSAIWIFDVRYWLTLMPFLIIYSWFAIENILKRIVKKTVPILKLTKYLLLILAICILFSIPLTFGQFMNKNAEYPFKDDNLATAKMALSNKVTNLTENDAIIMGCDIGVYNFYTDRHYIAFPSEPRDNVVDIMKFYKVHYFTLLGCERRAIDVEFYSFLVNSVMLEKKEYAKGMREVIVRDYVKKDIYKINVPTTLIEDKLYKIEFTNKTEGNTTETAAVVSVY